MRIEEIVDIPALTLQQLISRVLAGFPNINALL
jgi:hypothetical protein